LQPRFRSTALDTRSLAFTVSVSLAAVHQLDVQSRSQLMRYCEEDSNHLEQQYR